MKPCTTCGNEIPETESRCRFCGRQQTAVPGGPKRARRRVVTVNLEAGRPTVEEALRTLDLRVTEARQRGTRLLKVIHGWGSSGAGGAIKAALPAHLAELRRRGLVRRYLPGDDYSSATPAGRALLARHPELAATLRTDERNAGITWVEV